MSRGLVHEKPVGGETNDWITPRWVIDALGPFDLDPCASATQPWPCAARQVAPPDDGTDPFHWRPGERVWLNPPYGRHTARWIALLHDHTAYNRGGGTALIFARTDTILWQRLIFPRAHAVTFIRGRLRFHRPDGTPAGPCGAPSALVAFGRAPSALVAFGRADAAYLYRATSHTEGTFGTEGTCGSIPGTWFDLTDKGWIGPPEESSAPGAPSG